MIFGVGPPAYARPARWTIATIAKGTIPRGIECRLLIDNNVPEH
jgi:hypothetical protein